jgi:hypothetical protein
MTVGDLKKLLAPLDDALPVIVVAPCLDEDGDDCETWFSVRAVTAKMDEDTGEEYANFECDRLDGFEVP